MRRLAGAPELLDGPLDVDTLAGNLRDLRRLNAWLGGAGVSWRVLLPLLPPRDSPRALRLLDVGTGAGDIPSRLLRYAAAAGIPLEIVASDVRPEVVAIARATGSGWPEFEVQLDRADRISAESGSFDVVHSSMVLHHLDPPVAVASLREMARVARRAVIVNDLDRSLIWLRLARALTRMATRNRYTRHDAPLSVRRAYRPAELVDLAGQAGLAEEARYWARPRYRYAIVFRHA